MVMIKTSGRGLFPKVLKNLENNKNNKVKNKKCFKINFLIPDFQDVFRE
jgi:hypothetical protein